MVQQLLTKAACWFSKREAGKVTKSVLISCAPRQGAFDLVNNLRLADRAGRVLSDLSDSSVRQLAESWLEVIHRMDTCRFKLRWPDVVETTRDKNIVLPKMRESGPWCAVRLLRSEQVQGRRWARPSQTPCGLIWCSDWTSLLNADCLRTAASLGASAQTQTWV